VTTQRVRARIHHFGNQVQANGLAVDATLTERGIRSDIAPLNFQYQPNAGQKQRS